MILNINIWNIKISIFSDIQKIYINFNISFYIKNKYEIWVIKVYFWCRIKFSRTFDQ